MKLLLTRPILDSERLAKKLRNSNFQIILTPLLEIKLSEIHNSIYKKQYDLIILTSKNSVRTIEPEKLLYKKVFTIGKGTFDAAVSKGFKNIENSDGSSKELKKLFLDTFNKKKIRILHPTSNNSNDELDNFFKRQGSNYMKREVYHVKKINIFPHLFKSFLHSNKGIISIFSPKTAEVFYDEVLRMGLQNNCHDKILVILSKSVKEKLNELTFKKIIIIEKPNEVCFINNIEKIKKFMDNHL